MNIYQTKHHRNALWGLAAGLLFLLICTDYAFTQTKWFKYEGNPILDLGPKGAWDDDWIHIDRVIRQDSVYRMWYSGGWKISRIGHAKSRDGATWTKDKLNPVLDAGPSPWENSVHRAYVILADSNYHMWYTGDDFTNFRVGYASSRNGIRWKKHSRNPVLDISPPDSWDKGKVGLQSVVGPDSSGGYKMWYQGYDLKFGHATSTNETNWTKYPEPVFWGNDVAWYPRVILGGQLYEMWCGLRNPTGVRSASGYPQPGVFGYVTSLDGIHWTVSLDNPVLWPGPDGAWDDAGLVVGDVLFDGQLYHMWYNGDDGSNKWRGGYAIAPKEMSITVSPPTPYLKPRSASIRVSAQVKNSQGLSFLASLRTTIETQQNPEWVFPLLGMREVAILRLLDDGLHQDGVAGDEVFANTWTPQDENLYFLDMKLNINRQHSFNFDMRKAAVFTTIGPLACEEVIFAGDDTANPGDTILIRLKLRNHGTSTAARSVTALISTIDASISNVTESSPVYGDIQAGKTATTAGYYRIFVNPFAPLETDAVMKVSISSWGIPLWFDTITLHVTPPWWRTSWAYAAYILVALGSVGGTIRFVGMRRLKRRIELLEKERALERERARISQDMHDEVGATLTEISILSELAKKKPREANKHIRQISERSAEVIDSFGEIVWALNPKNDTLDNLLAYARRYSIKYLSLSRIKCRFNMPESIPPATLSTEIRRNLFLVIKEALHNVVKHSNAREVSIVVTCAQARLTVSIVDDGRGFETEARSVSGNGLTNMKKRIAEIGGSHSLESVKKKGTRISIEVALTGIT